MSDTSQENENYLGVSEAVGTCQETTRGNLKKIKIVVCVCELYAAKQEVS